MSKQKRYWKKVAAYALASAMVLQGGMFAAEGTALAEEEIQLQELLELTSPDLETGEGSAATARLKIGDWLDYGDYGIERTDIPGTAYRFSITTKDENENLINDQQIAYCIQSYFLTPLPGDHTIDMTDHVLSVNGEKTVHKALYYGFGGAGYDVAEFEAFLEETNPDYFNQVYVNLEDYEKEELAYILTHAAASYAYYTDGTDFERFLELQFEIKYGDAWEENLGYFIRADVAKAEAAAGDLNLFGSTYGMNDTGITLSKAWYDVLAAKKAPDLSVTAEADVYTFNGNEKNEELSLTFTVPADWACEVTGEDGQTAVAAAGEEVIVTPAEQFVLDYVSETASKEPGVIAASDLTVDGTLAGAENEIWNLVIFETNKGTNATVSKRQQDIAAVSRIDAGKTELDFTVDTEVGSLAVTAKDHAGNLIPNTVFGVYYDEACTIPMQQNGEDVVLTTDVAGKAYLEFVINRQMKENGGGLYVKQTDTLTGYIADEHVYNTAEVQELEIYNVLEAVALNGTISWNMPDGTGLPESVTVVLEQDGAVYATKEVSAADGWSYEWNELPKYNVETGEAYAYTVTVEPVEGYATVTDGNNLVNTISSVSEVAGQITWQDGGDADGLRPDSLTVELYRNGEVVDRAEVNAENDWTYTFTDVAGYSEDGSEAYEYTVGIADVEGYEIVMDDGAITVKHAASALAVLETAVDLAGRALWEGAFVFDLVQVTDAAGTEVVEGGIAASAVNDADGKVVFEEIQITEPGTYYYKITGKPADENGAIQADPIEYTAQIEAVLGGENGDQIEVAVSYVDAEGNSIDPQDLKIEASYQAAGTVTIDPITIAAASGVLEEGQYEVQLIDAEGNVLQTVINDAEGKVVFETLEFTQDDIGNEYTYTIRIVDPSGAAEAQEYQMTVKVEDSEAGDGTLQITCEAAAMVFEVPGTETEAETEAATEAAAEAAAEAETETETGNPVVKTFSFSFLILLILYLIRWWMKRKKK